MNMKIRDINSLKAAIKNGLNPKYLFFWGHTPKNKEQVDKSCLSQWFPASFVVDGINYPTAEHFMMAEKALLFEDSETLQKILQASHPNEAKKFGRMVQHFKEPVWAKYRFEIVVNGNEAKFAQNPALRQFLLNTHDCILVEASPYDKIWGIGLAADDPQVQNPEAWRGLNLLGFALMEVRARLQESS